MEIEISNSTTRRFFVRGLSGLKVGINKMLAHSWEGINIKSNGITVYVSISMLHPTVRERVAERIWEAIKE